jgi:chaperone BCS1
MRGAVTIDGVFHRVNNHTLGELFHSTPSHSILLIEDIDCAFPLRGDLSDEVASRDVYGEAEMAERRSEVTLAGLLNILDSVVSQEGRILIATVGILARFQLICCSTKFQTNHIDQLDPGKVTLLPEIRPFH